MKTKNITTKEIRTFISKNPKLTNKEIAETLGCGLKWTNIRANRAHITMNTDTETPNPRKAPVKGTNYVADGVKKRDARFNKVKPIINSKLLDGRVISLCGESVLIETMLYRNGATKFQYDLVENSPVIYNKILQKVSTLPLDVKSITRGKLSEKIFEAVEDTFSHAIYDYCGLLRTHRAEIEYTFANNIVKKDGIIAMTFATRGAKPVVDCDPVKGEAISYTAAKKYFSSFKGYKLIKSFKYKDTGDMMVFIVQRID